MDVQNRSSRPEAILKMLMDVGIHPTIKSHRPVRTVDDAKALADRLPGVNLKSLLLRDKKRRLWLVCLVEDRALNMKHLRQFLDARGNLSFADEQTVGEILGVEPGGISPLSAANTSPDLLTVVLDSDAVKADAINCALLSTDATVALSPAELLNFLNLIGFDPIIYSTEL